MEVLHGVKELEDVCARRAQRWSSHCPHAANDSTTSLSPKRDEWTSPDFIWIRNEAQQRKLIRHHPHPPTPHSGQAMNRPKEHHLLRLILYCIPPVTLKCSIAPLLGMNQDMGSPSLPSGTESQGGKLTAPSGLCSRAMGSWWPSFPLLGLFFWLWKELFYCLCLFSSGIFIFCYLFSSYSICFFGKRL